MLIRIAAIHFHVDVTTKGYQTNPPLRHHLIYLFFLLHSHVTIAFLDIRGSI